MTQRKTIPSLVCLAAGLAPAQAQPEYTCTVVDAFAATYNLRETYLWDINDQGAACGYTTTSQTVNGNTSIFPTDFHWSSQAGKVAFPSSWGVKAINNLGVIAGAGRLFDNTTSQYTDLPSIPSTYGAAIIASISDSNTAVGYVKVCNCSNSNGMFQVPYIWDPINGARTLNIPNAKSANRVNNAGIVIGETKLTAGVPEGFVHDLNTGATTLLTPYFPPAPSFTFRCRPRDINDEGIIVGEYSSPDTNYSWRGFLWSTSAGLSLLPNPAPGEPVDLSPFALNSAGTVVGQHGALYSESHAFIYDSARGLRDLNSLASNIPTGFTLRRAWRINDKGWIVGDGNGGGGFSKAFILRPVGNTCYANCDASTATPLLTANDFQCFLNSFAAADPYANCDQSSGIPTLTANDFQCFLNTFAAGCP
jgi:hypothetical protein